MSAFSEFTRATSIEAQRLPPATGATSRPLLALTRGLAARHADPAGPSAAATDAAHLTLPDGRLRVGTHLGLMAHRYRYLSLLGEGVSSQVILAEDTLGPVPGQLVAIKAMRRQHALAGRREARALRFLHSAAAGGSAPGLVRLLDTFQLGSHFCLVTERLFPWLLDWVAASAELPPADALRQLRKMAHQLLVALAHMHSQGVVSADVKPDNILLCSPPGSARVAVKLVDLGNSFSLTETDHLAVGREMQTLPYRAPEAALGLPCGAPIDVFSLGVVLAEMALKRALFPCATPRDLLCQMVALLGPLPHSMVQPSALGQQIGATMLCLSQRAAVGAAVARANPAAPPAELAGLAAAAARRADPMAGLDLPTPQQLQRCQLHAELAAVDASLADLVLSMLRYDPAQRITAHQALLHPFFDALWPLRSIFPQLERLAVSPQTVPAAEGQAGKAAVEPTALAPAAVLAHEPAARTARAPVGAAPAVRPSAGMGVARGNPLPQSTATVVAAAAEAEAAEAEGAARNLAGPTVTARWGRQPQGLYAAQQLAPMEAGQLVQQGVLHKAAVPVAQAHPADMPGLAAARSPQQQPVQQQPQQLQQPALSVQASNRRQRQSPLRPMLPPPRLDLQPHQQAGQARLPAAQVAEQQWEVRRRMAAATPYAGSFSPRFEPTPVKEQLAKRQAQQRDEQHTQQQQQQQDSLPNLPQPPQRQQQQESSPPQQQIEAAGQQAGSPLAAAGTQAARDAAGEATAGAATKRQQQRKQPQPGRLTAAVAAPAAAPAAGPSAKAGTGVAPVKTEPGAVDVGRAGPAAQPLSALGRKLPARTERKAAPRSSNKLAKQSAAAAAAAAAEARPAKATPAGNPDGSGRAATAGVDSDRQGQAEAHVRALDLLLDAAAANSADEAEDTAQRGAGAKQAGRAGAAAAQPGSKSAGGRAQQPEKQPQQPQQPPDRRQSQPSGGKVRPGMTPLKKPGKTPGDTPGGKPPAATSGGGTSQPPRTAGQGQPQHPKKPKQQRQGEKVQQQQLSRPDPKTATAAPAGSKAPGQKAAASAVAAAAGGERAAPASAAGKSTPRRASAHRPAATKGAGGSKPGDVAGRAAKTPGKAAVGGQGTHAAGRDTAKPDAPGSSRTLPTATTPAAQKRKRSEIAAAAGATDSQTVTAAAAAAAAADVQETSTTSTGPPATAAKRQRREPTPWWMA